MNSYHTLKFLEYQLIARSRKGFGIHSPFIFDLITRVFRNKTANDIVCNIEKIRKGLIRNTEFIEVNDLGSGAGKRKSNKRKVSQITRHSAIPPVYGTLLAGLAAEFGNKSIIELGTSFGISTMYLAMSAPKSVIYTIEGCPACARIAMENFKQAGISNINQLIGSFDYVLPQLIDSGITPDLVFIDGNHLKEPVLRYFDMLSAVSTENTVFVFDDIHDSREMTEAWEIIMQNEMVSATVDLFRMGIVFLRQGITNNNYIIRY